MAALIIRSDGTRFRHTSLDLPEDLVLEAKRRRLSIARICSRAMANEFGLKDPYEGIV